MVICFKQNNFLLAIHWERVKFSCLSFNSFHRNVSVQAYCEETNFFLFVCISVRRNYCNSIRLACNYVGMLVRYSELAMWLLVRYDWFVGKMQDISFHDTMLFYENSEDFKISLFTEKELVYLIIDLNVKIGMLKFRSYMNLIAVKICIYQKFETICTGCVINPCKF